MTAPAAARRYRDTLAAHASRTGLRLSPQLLADAALVVCGRIAAEPETWERTLDLILPGGEKPKRENIRVIPGTRPPSCASSQRGPA